MRAAGSMTSLAADVPFGYTLRLDVVINGMTAVAERACRALVIVRGIEGHPPIRPLFDEIRTPDAVHDVPLRPQRIIIVALLTKISLLPLTAVNERYIVLLELQQRIGLAEIGDDGVRMLLRIADDIGHARLLPAFINRGVTRLAR